MDSRSPCFMVSASPGRINAHAVRPQTLAHTRYVNRLRHAQPHDTRIASGISYYPNQPVHRRCPSWPRRWRYLVCCASVKLTALRFRRVLFREVAAVAALGIQQLK